MKKVNLEKLERNLKLFADELNSRVDNLQCEMDSIELLEDDDYYANYTEYESLFIEHEDIVGMLGQIEDAQYAVDYYMREYKNEST